MSDTLLADPGTQAAPDAPPAPAATPPAQQAASSKGFVADDGKFQDGWLDRLDPALQPAHATLAKYRDLPALAKSHFELQQMLGKKSAAINIPGEGATPEDIGAFRKAIGAPESPDGYNLKPEKLPDGIAWSDESAKGYAEIAHRHNIPVKAMQELAAYQLAQEGARFEESGKMFTAQLETNRQVLKTEWGGNYDKNLQMAERAAKTVGANPDSDGFRDPEVVKAFARFAGLMSEDKLVSGDFSPSNQPGVGRAKDIMTNAANPLYAKYQQGDHDTVAMVRGMLQHG